MKNFKKTLPEISKYLSECDLEKTEKIEILLEKENFTKNLTKCKNNDEVLALFVQYRNRLFLSSIMCHKLCNMTHNL